MPAEPPKWAALASPSPPPSSLLFHFASAFLRRRHYISPPRSPFVPNNKPLLTPFAFQPSHYYPMAAATTTTTTTTTTVVVGATTPLTPSIRIQIPITPFSSPCSAPPPSVSSATSSLPNSQRPKLCLLPPPPTPHFSPNLFMKSKAASGPNSFLTPPTTSLSPHNRDSCRSYHLSNLHSWQPSCGSSAVTSSRA